jgi:hypothetical protein
MDADGSKWRDQPRWSLWAERVTSAAVEDTALSSEQTVALRASVRRHRSIEHAICARRSIRPMRATNGFSLATKLDKALKMPGAPGPS